MATHETDRRGQGLFAMRLRDEGTGGQSLAGEIPVRLCGLSSVGMRCCPVAQFPWAKELDTYVESKRSMIGVGEASMLARLAAIMKSIDLHGVEDDDDEELDLDEDTELDGEMRLGMRLGVGAKMSASRASRRAHAGCSSRLYYGAGRLFENRGSGAGRLRRVGLYCI